MSLLDAIHVAGAAGRLNPVVLRFDPNDRYNVWSGLIGGMFLALAYFGTDQTQVQRYLTGKSIAQSRLSLLFNAVAKIPMQFFILFTGAMVFVFYTFEQPPLLFDRDHLARIQDQSDYAGARRDATTRHSRQRRAAAQDVAASEQLRRPSSRFKAAQAELDAARKEGAQRTGIAGFNDTNYIFLTFVTRYLPAGVVGLILAVILAAAMTSISGEINSLATVSVVDIYKRHFRPAATDHHYLIASRMATVFWGIYAVSTAQFGANLGSLIEAVNRLGSLFYGGMLGVFVLAFFLPRVKGSAAFFAVLAGEAAIFSAYLFTGISFLWYNVIGALVVVAVGYLLSVLRPAAAVRS